MLVSTKGRYALRAVVDIAENSRVDRVSLRSVAERQGISDKYLEAIIKPLVVAGILASVRGKNGGYQLARPASDITAGDVIRAVEGEVASAPLQRRGRAMRTRFAVPHCSFLDGTRKRGGPVS